MPIPNAALQSFESHLPKVISPMVHGYIDYAHAAFFFSMAIACRKSNRPAALAALGTGAFVLVESLLTDYPLGLKRLIPFKTHGEMDAAFAASSLLVPRLFGFQGSKAAIVFETNAFVEATVVGLTDFSSSRARAEEKEE